MTTSDRPRSSFTSDTPAPPRTSSWLPDAPAPPRTLDEAVERAPEATLAVLGAPRAIVAVEVRRALERGLDVLVVGEGLAVDAARTERAFAAERGLVLAMDDVLLDGFVVRGALLEVPRGPLGVLGADVAAAVEATAIAARAGYGTNHAIVVGESDFDPAGEGTAAAAAVARLGADAATAAIVIAAAGDARVLRALQHACVATGKPTVICAFDCDARRGIGWEWIASLGELPRALVRLGVDPIAATAAAGRAQPAGLVLGALSAPSLAHEVIAVMMRAGLDVASNVPHAGVLPEDVGGHTVLALADPAARAAWLRSFAIDDLVSAVVVDLPATELAESEAAAIVAALRDLATAARTVGAWVRIVVSRPRGTRVGTGVLDGVLEAIGVTVVEGAEAAASVALDAPTPAAPSSFFAGRPLSVITLAADDVAASLATRGMPVLPTAWTAPAGGDPRIARLVGLLR